ncbi:MAG TPA: hypothetical protein VK144_01955 [Bacillota bacterium]|nr:hypothetical protein [Bacillota bacterium]
MVTFFIVISFCIHALSLAAIYVLYKQGQQPNNKEINEIDQLMHSYVTKIQQENNDLQKALQEKSNLTLEKQDMNEYISSDKNGTTERKEETKEEAEKQWDPATIIEPTEDTIETSLESRVLQLHRGGMSVNDIAKKLHCGKTEASLIIQFQSKD